MGGGEHRSLNQQPSGFTPVLGLGKSEILKKKTKAFTLAEVLIPKRVSEIKNKVFNFRGGKIKEPFNLNKKLAAFTLAEVLITLAIIGVVAALTIPTVVAKYQKKMYYTQFIKVYNTIINAVDLAQSEYGVLNTWGLGDKNKNAEIMNNNLYSNLKVSKICNTLEDCCVEDLEIKYLNYINENYGYTGASFEDFFFFNQTGANVLLLNDGSMVAFYPDHFSGTRGTLQISFDTNGAKGPNILGRDVFSITSTYGFEDRKDGFIVDLTLDEAIYDCSTTSESEGFTCFERLLLEGKMDY